MPLSDPQIKQKHSAMILFFCIKYFMVLTVFSQYYCTIFRCAASVSYTHLDVYKRQPIQRQRQGARNGRGCHHQHIRCPPFIFQSQTLPHTKAMLFINHHCPQIGKLHLLLNQRMGAYGNGDVYKRQGSATKKQWA